MRDGCKRLVISMMKRWRRVVSGPENVRIREVPGQKEEGIGGGDDKGCNGVNNANPLYSRTFTE